MEKPCTNEKQWKAMKNLRWRIDVRLVSKKKQRTKKELYITKIFNNDLSAISKSKVRLKLTKPAHVAMCMLALSKLLIYKFRYDYIENEYGSNSKLLFTDTDSLRYEIKTEDVYKNFS